MEFCVAETKRVAAIHLEKSLSETMNWFIQSRPRAKTAEFPEISHEMIQKPENRMSSTASGAEKPHPATILSTKCESEMPWMVGRPREKTAASAFDPTVRSFPVKAPRLYSSEGCSNLEQFIIGDILLIQRRRDALEVNYRLRSRNLIRQTSTPGDGQFIEPTGENLRGVMHQDLPRQQSNDRTWIEEHVQETSLIPNIGEEESEEEQIAQEERV
jgi:hypothetical protein